MSKGNAVLATRQACIAFRQDFLSVPGHVPYPLARIQQKLFTLS